MKHVTLSWVDAYFTIRSCIPRPCRRAIRRWMARRTVATCGDTWPINARAGHTPPGWRGWPVNKRFAVVLTHDVETRRGLPKCEAVMRIEAGLGFRSSFNFVPEDYTVERCLWNALTRGGFEIGVHGLKHDGKLFRSRETFDQSVPKLNAHIRAMNAQGFRAPFTYCKPDWIHAIDVKYDSSMFDTDPFEPEPGGVETIFPYWVPDPASAGGYVELPYTLPQDSTLFIVLQQTDASTWISKLDWIARQGGMALLNVHPDYVAPGPARPGPDEYPEHYYRDFLAYLKATYDGKYWHALPRDVAALIAAQRSPTLPPDAASASNPRAT